MTDKEQEFLMDATEIGESSCCGASVYAGDICKECGEHCSLICDDEDEDEI